LVFGDVSRGEEARVIKVLVGAGGRGGFLPELLVAFSPPIFGEKHD